jgi:hypothetical protein
VGVAIFIDVHTCIYIYVRLKSMYCLRSVSSPSNLCLPTNPCPVKLLYPQFRVLSPRRSVSFGIASHSNLNLAATMLNAPLSIIMTSFFCQSEGNRSEGKSIWGDTDLSEKRFEYLRRVCGCIKYYLSRR